MDWHDAVFGRRSIRRYTGESVSEESIETLLRAAMAAPSAHNRQPWRFVVIQAPESLQALSQATSYSSMIAGAPLALAICADTTVQENAGYWAQDCSAAMQNLLITAHAIGLGAVWVGVHPLPERVATVREILGLPEPIQVLGLVSIGHPSETKDPSQRFEPEYIHRERWGGGSW